MTWPGFVQCCMWLCLWVCSCGCILYLYVSSHPVCNSDFAHTPGDMCSLSPAEFNMHLTVYSAGIKNEVVRIRWSTELDDNLAILDVFNLHTSSISINWSLLDFCNKCKQCVSVSNFFLYITEAVEFILRIKWVLHHLQDQGIWTPSQDDPIRGGSFVNQLSTPLLHSQNLRTGQWQVQWLETYHFDQNFVMNVGWSTQYLMPNIAVNVALSASDSEVDKFISIPPHGVLSAATTPPTDNKSN